MKNWILTVALLSLSPGLPAIAQPVQSPEAVAARARAQAQALEAAKAPAVEDFKPSSLNQPGKQYPQVNSERRVRARVVAPQAQNVVLDIGGVKYPLTKGDDGAWVGESGPQDEGFPLLPDRDRWRAGPGPRQPVFLRRQPLGQRRRSPRPGPGLLCAQECASRPVAADSLLFQERQRRSPLLCLHAAGL